jgi:hypothetical protein
MIKMTVQPQYSANNYAVSYNNQVFTAKAKMINWQDRNGIVHKDRKLDSDGMTPKFVYDKFDLYYYLLEFADVSVTIPSSVINMTPGEYKTAMHAFQAAKFNQNSQEFQKIKAKKTARGAYLYGRMSQDIDNHLQKVTINPDSYRYTWNQWDAISYDLKKAILYYKALQNPAVMRSLQDFVDTNSYLVFGSDDDSNWGAAQVKRNGHGDLIANGNHQRGLNRFGEVVEEVIAQLIVDAKLFIHTSYLTRSWKWASPIPQIFIDAKNKSQEVLSITSVTKSNSSSSSTSTTSPITQVLGAQQPQHISTAQTLFPQPINTTPNSATSSVTLVTSSVTSSQSYSSSFPIKPPEETIASDIYSTTPTSFQSYSSIPIRQTLFGASSPSVPTLTTDAGGARVESNNNSNTSSTTSQSTTSGITPSTANSTY